MEDMWRSIKSIFNERISSPFYGSLIVSWLLWNWKIPYVTLFIDGDKLDINKIDYIINHCNNPWHLTVLPLVSTVLIIAVLPFVTNYASKITQKFDAQRVEDKNEILKKQLLTIEQSVQLRLEIQTIEEKFEKTITTKDSEIKTLKEQFANLAKEHSDLKNDIFFHANSGNLKAKEQIALLADENEKLTKNKNIVAGSSANLKAKITNTRPTKSVKETKGKTELLGLDDLTASISKPMTLREGLKLDKIVNKIESDKLAEIYKEIASEILNNREVRSDKRGISEFITYGLIQHIKTITPFTSTYKLTSIGREVNDKLLFG